ncbi:MAG: alpha/beta fold hydrolase [bacterium]|nr:alpha/beta fold hydrolase [bacterium]
MALAVCNSIQIYYEDLGAGSSRIPVVFIHGFTLNNTMWSPQKQALRGTHRVVSYDLRGHGRSEKPATGYSRDEEVKDLMDLLNVIRAPKAHLVGLSRGGGIAIQAAAQHPEKVASLVAFDAGYDFARFMPEFLDQRLQTMATLRAEGLKAARDYWLSLPLFSPARENEDLAAQLDSILLTYTGTHWLDEGPSNDASLADMASSITARTLIVVGDRDLPGFQACADELAGKIPGAEKRVVAGAGHMTSMEAAEETNEMLLGFFSKPGA